MRTPFYGWVVVGASFAALFIIMGSVFSYQVFIPPLEEEFGWGRASTALTMSVLLVVNGFSYPFVGNLVDRYGARKILTLCAGLVGASLLGLSSVSNILQLYALYAVIGFGISGLGTGVVTAIVIKWFTKRTALASAIAISGVSIGLLVLTPLAARLIPVYGWRSSFFTLGTVVALIAIPLTFLFIRSPPSSPEPDARPNPDVQGEGGSAGPGKVVGVSVKKALKTTPIWLLILSFFVCGFTTIGLVTTHLVPYLIAKGFGAGVAADAAGVEGGMTIAGLVALGALGDRYGKKGVLASIYFLRGMALLYLTTVQDVAGAFAFAAVFGLFDLSTVPLMAGITADVYGRGTLATLFGFQFTAHQLGAAIAAYLAGWLFDLLNSYLWAHLLGVGLLMLASILILLIRMRRG